MRAIYVTIVALIAMLGLSACWHVDANGCVQFADGVQYPVLDYSHDEWRINGILVGTSDEEDAECITPA